MSEWKIDTLPIPWDARHPSIYDHVFQHIEPGRDCLREGRGIFVLSPFISAPKV
jgi:hypothetical protein